MKALMHFSVALLGTGCSLEASGPSIPEGWKRVEIGNCCRGAVPPNVILSETINPVDDRSFVLRGPSYKGLIVITNRGTGVPIPGSGKNYRTGALEVAGDSAQIASFETDDEDLPFRHSLVWTFRGENDGTGESLTIDMSCADAECAIFRSFARTLSPKS